MSDKLNIQDLIDLLAEKHSMDRPDAESFVKEFFALIEKSLGKDKYVKVKGLGTFRLINVESRESININTGERFEIQGHSKISFTPETLLKEAVNKPFAHFEPVLLNENVTFDDMPADSNVEDIPAPTETMVEAEKENTRQKGSAFTKYLAGSAIVVGLVCVGVVGLMYWPEPKRQAENEVRRDTMQAGNADEGRCVPDSVSVVFLKNDTDDKKAAVDTIYTPRKKAKKTTAVTSGDLFVPDSVHYEIVGTKTTYTMQEGETLTKVSLRFYGTKALWPYIVEHNRELIKNPDKVPSGVTMKIPELVRKE